MFDDAVRAAQSGDLQNVVQDYVKSAVSKASGLGWLFDAVTGNTEEQARDQRKRR
jgi:hypothetical protein